MKLLKPTNIKYKFHIPNGRTSFKTTYLKFSVFKIFGIRIWNYIPVISSYSKGIHQIPYPSIEYLGSAWFQNNDDLYKFMKTYDTYEKLEVYLQDIKTDYENRKIVYNTTLAEKKKEYNLI